MAVVVAQGSGSVPALGSDWSRAYNNHSLGLTPVHTYHSSPVKPARFNQIVPPKPDATDSLRPGLGEVVTLLDTRGEDSPWPGLTLRATDGEPVYVGPRMNELNTHRARLSGQELLCFFTDTNTTGVWRCLDEHYSLALEVGPNLAGWPEWADESNPDIAVGADPHEFQLTEHGTAILHLCIPTPADLSWGGGAVDGWVEDSVLQEIELATGAVLFEWRALDHFSPQTTYHPVGSYMTHTGESPESPFDAFHFNSFQKDALGNYLVSLRGPSLIVYLDGRSGSVLWQLGGGKGAPFTSTDFRLGTGASWWFQHHVRIIAMDDKGRGPSRISFFVNGANERESREPSARGVVLQLDHDRREATLERAFFPSFNGTVGAGGSMQLLLGADGTPEQVLIGWGGRGQYSVYSYDDGDLLEDTQISPEGSSIHSYRVLRDTWRGQTQGMAPKFAVAFEEDELGSLAGYASWNGATEVAHWRLLGGGHIDRLKSLSTVTKAGFETKLVFEEHHAYLAAAAYDQAGRCMAVSAIHSLEAGRSFGFYGNCDAIWWADWALTFNLTATALFGALCALFGWRKVGRRFSAGGAATLGGYLALPPTPKRNS